ncbi:hypothetical protein EJD97_002428 [Solanum chilense]|uniref:Uncharacterized protein n=1 Tax=Solanum chilense TaxID=4083 RepID=A0A6N2BWD0_SOLCI|nr:hypothetical protein EJD97_002428 [Solanum chilense]
MNTIRMAAEEVPPQLEQVHQVLQGAQVTPQGDKVQIVKGGNDFLVVHRELTNREIREAFLALARAMTTQVNFSMHPRINVVGIFMTSRLRDFVKMNPPFFFTLRWEMIPKSFLMVSTSC